MCVSSSSQRLSGSTDLQATPLKDSPLATRRRAYLRRWTVAPVVRTVDAAQHGRTADVWPLADWKQPIEEGCKATL
jgi:hypothetical protein